jgi:hypothetical protein
MLLIVGSTWSAKVEAGRAAIALTARVDERLGHATLRSVDLTHRRVLGAAKNV